MTLAFICLALLLAFIFSFNFICDKLENIYESWEDKKISYITRRNSIKMDFKKEMSELFPNEKMLFEEYSHLI